MTTAPFILPFTTLDVFSSTPYAGNPLAIVHVPSHVGPHLTQSQKQLVAREFNLSETIFLHERMNADPVWTIDIFTITEELPFAGHPTIGAAVYVLLLQKPPGSSTVLGAGSAGRLLLKAGVVNISALEDGTRVTAEVPHDVHIHARTLANIQTPAAGLSENLQLREAERKAPVVSIVKGMTFLLVDVGDLELLGKVECGGGKSPGFQGLLDNEGGWDKSFVARYYFTVLGEDGGIVRVRSRMVELTMEDPATGSAACALSAWLALRRKSSTNFEIKQGVEMGRESVIAVEVKLDDEGTNVKKVMLSGRAGQVMEGTIRI